MRSVNAGNIVTNESGEIVVVANDDSTLVGMLQSGDKFVPFSQNEYPGTFEACGYFIYSDTIVDTNKAFHVNGVRYELEWDSNGWTVSPEITNIWASPNPTASVIIADGYENDDWTTTEKLIIDVKHKNDDSSMPLVAVTSDGQLLYIINDYSVNRAFAMSLKSKEGTDRTAWADDPVLDFRTTHKLTNGDAAFLPISPADETAILHAEDAIANFSALASVFGISEHVFMEW